MATALQNMRQPISQGVGPGRLQLEKQNDTVDARFDGSWPYGESHKQTIRQGAQQCQESFINIFYGISRDDTIIGRLPRLFGQSLDASPTLTISDVKDEFEQFRVWASNIGVFAADHASLDYRLREAADVKQGIVALLTSLNDDLSEVLALLKADRQYDSGSEAGHHAFDNDSSSGSDISDLDDATLVIYELQSRLEHIPDIIDKLSHISRVIRTSGIRSRTIKAANYIHYEDGVDQTEIFETVYLPEVLKRRYHVPEPLLARFCEAISLRRRRFMFYQKHQKRLAAYSTTPQVGFSSDASVGQTIEFMSTDLVEGLRETQAAAVPVQHTSIAVPSGITHPTRATTFRPAEYHKVAPSTMVASTTKVAMCGAELPPPPRPGPGSSHFQCPYCHLLVENKKAAPIQWRKHVINDLQPFICVEPSCPEPRVVLESWADWLEHQRWTHAMEWWCEGIDGDHSPMRFITAGEYSEHLLNQHMSALSIQDVSRRINNSGGASQEPFRYCPLCDFQAESNPLIHSQDTAVFARSQQKKLQTHIFEHLLSLFVLALPDRHDLHDAISEEEFSDLFRSSMDIEHSDGSPGSENSAPQSLPQPKQGLGGLTARHAMDLASEHLPLNMRSQGGEQANDRTSMTSNPILHISQHRPPRIKWRKEITDKSDIALTNNLMEASAVGDIEATKLSLESGADVNAVRNVDFAEPMLMTICDDKSSKHDTGAMWFSHDPGITAPMVAGFINSDGVLQAAAYNNHDQADPLPVGSEVYIDHIITCSSNALQLASIAGHEHIVQMLLDAGADVNATGGKYGTALQAASNFGHEKVVQLLCQAGARGNEKGGLDEDALQLASKHGHAGVVQMLIDFAVEFYAPVGEYGNALHTASEHGHDRVVQALINSGIDVNAEGGRNETALKAASSGGHEKVVQMLIDAGANVNMTTRGNSTILEAAAKHGHEKVVQLLLDAGANVNDPGGVLHDNVLLVASKYGHEEIVQLLLKAGADVKTYGRSAFDAASSNSHEKVAQVLLDAGACGNVQFG